MIIFPDVTQLDFTGPYEVFARLPQAQVYILAPTLDPVRSERGLTFVPDTSFDAAPKLDILFVPGGGGVNKLIENQIYLDFLRSRSLEAAYVTSVCTGALVLGAAGLLNGYNATTHWLSLDLLTIFGAHPKSDRVVIDRNRITGGGITAGIDFALTLAQHLFGDEVAQSVQLAMEYNPLPPFNSGSPVTAPVSVVNSVISATAARQEERKKVAKQAALRLLKNKEIS